MQGGKAIGFDITLSSSYNIVIILMILSMQILNMESASYLTLSHSWHLTNDQNAPMNLFNKLWISYMQEICRIGQDFSTHFIHLHKYVALSSASYV